MFNDLTNKFNYDYLTIDDKVMYPFRICGDVVGKKINSVPEYCPRLKGIKQRSWTRTGVQKKSYTFVLEHY